MKQLLQNLKTGETQLVEVPAPANRADHLLIATRCSLISIGTERMLVEFGKANMLAKARQQPDKVKMVLEKVKTDGLFTTMDAVKSKLDQPLPLGYCNVGTVVQAQSSKLKAQSLNVGVRVVSNGPHAEMVVVPKNLCAKIPDNVSDEEASFTVLGAIALEGIRLARPTLGESFVVTGLGLIGLLAVQLLRAHGCRVLGIDFDEKKLELARRFGAETVSLNKGENPVEAGMAFSKGRGVDGVLICATTKSSDPVSQAARMCRKRGRIVLIGVTGLSLSRSDFYEKELSFQVSCSYGPGRYDPEYEQKGYDYPFGYVRWTEQRNFEAVLQLLADGSLDVKSLITDRIPLAQAKKAYQLLTNSNDNLGILLTYPTQTPPLNQTIRYVSASSSPASNQTTVGAIGAGNFAVGVLLPALRRTPARLKTIASRGGTSAALAARKFGFEAATTDYRTILDDQEINAVIITTRHNTHAHLVTEALQAGKHVFVEKPLALNREQLAKIREAYVTARDRQLLVGYNRRFSPLAVKMHDLLKGRSQPLSLIYTMNAGEIPPDHWTQDPAIGGGRIIGEACHAIDFLCYLTGSAIIGLDAMMMGDAAGAVIREDKMTILLAFEDGSLGTVHYFANGSKRYPKEQIEVFSEGRILVLDNFRKLEAYGWRGFKGKRFFRQEKGYKEEIAAFIELVTAGGKPLIPWNEIEKVSLSTFIAVEQAAVPLSPLL